MYFIKKIKIFRPLKNKSFRILFLSQFFNNAGMFMDYVALNALIVYKWQLGPTVLAIFSIVYAAPLLLSPVFGSIVDKSPIKKLMLISTLFTAILTLILFVVPNVFFLIIVVFFRAFSKIFYIPLENTAIQKIFHKEELDQATSLVQFFYQFFVIIGPILGAVLLAYLDVKSVFIITSSCYFMSLAVISFLSSDFNKIHKKNDKFNVKNIFIDLKDMLDFFVSEKKLFLGFASLALAQLCYFLGNSLLVLLAKSIGFTNENFEFIFVMLGIGGITSAVFLGNKKNSMESEKIILYGILIMGITFIFSAGICPVLTNSKLLMFLASWFFTGAGMCMISIGYSTLILKNVPSSMIGKASTLLLFCNGISICLGPAIGAGIANLCNVYVPFVLAGIIMIIIFTIFRFILLKFQKEKHY